MRYAILIMALLLLGVVGAQTIPSSTDIDITLVNQEPDPVEPGGVVKVKFRVENDGSKIAEDVQTELMSDYPFSVVPGEAPLKNIGSLEGVQTGTAGVTVEYKVKVDEDASEGDNDLALRYRTKGGQWVVIDDFTIRVASPDAFLSIEKVETNPPSIIPGQTASLTFELKNTASSLLRDIDVSLNFSATTTPFVPVDSSTMKTISRINPGETGTISFEITALPSASAGTYKVPITLTYSDEVPNSYTKESIIGLRVGGEPDLSVTLDSYTMGEASIKIVNKGLTDVKLMNVMLLESEDYTIDAGNEEYVGSVDSDDYETIDFKVTGKATEAALLLELEYLDANNVRYQEQAKVMIKSAANGGNGKSSVIGYVIVAVIVIAGILIYRKVRKKKKK